MIAILIILAVFFGIALVISVVAVSILIGNGTFTLPGTDARRVQHSQANLQIARIKFETEIMQHNIDEAIDNRVKRALTRGEQDA